jgi:hypothetical protein
MDSENKIVHGLWIGNNLSPLEILTIQSFLNKGHEFHLWSYEKISNIPLNTHVRDANEILLKNHVFSYKKSNKFGHGKGSLAGFSDIFRYKLLYELGGWWTDMDITSLKPLDFSEPYVFRQNGKKGIVGNLMKCPPKSELMSYCYDRASKEVTADNRNWMLPIDILNEGIESFNLSKYCKNLGNEDDFRVISKLILEKELIPDTWYMIHWMNEEWRRLNIDKHQFAKNSTITSLLSKYNIPIQYLDIESEKKLAKNVGEMNYRIINLKSRLKWILKI